jgi:hypothetical protein
LVVEPLFIHPRELLASTSDAERGDRCFPSITTAGAARLGGGESALWQGQTRVEELRYTEEFDDYDRVWELPALADVVVTDQRLLYVCARWDVGGGWSSWGAPVGTALLNVASRARAAARRRGVVMVGQIRWQWPTIMRVSSGSPGPATGRRKHSEPASVLLLTKAAATRGYPALRLFDGSVAESAVAARVSRLILEAIVRFRLDRAADLGVDEAASRRLGELVSATGPGAHGAPWQTRLPGPLLLWFLADDEYRSADGQQIAAGKAG